MEFRDILYGTIDLPDWIGPFIRSPELVRLRGIRLSNIDSVQYKDFNGPTRWEHSLAVAYLAKKCAEKRNLNLKDQVHLIIAALFHDFATPPFAHTIENVLSDYNHEIEAQNLLNSIITKDSSPNNQYIF